VRPTTWARAIPNGIVASYEYTKTVLLLPVQILRGDVSPEAGRPVGYKGMFDIFQEIQNRVWFFMVISMSLGIFNLLPIPALDGGAHPLHPARDPLPAPRPPKYENGHPHGSFALLLLLLIYVNLQGFYQSRPAPLMVPVE